MENFDRNTLPIDQLWINMEKDIIKVIAEYYPLRKRKVDGNKDGPQTENAITDANYTLFGLIKERAAMSKLL